MRIQVVPAVRSSRTSRLATPSEDTRISGEFYREPGNAESICTEFCVLVHSAEYAPVQDTRYSLGSGEPEFT